MLNRKKEMKLVVAFYTTTDALKMEKACKEEAIPGRLIPIPREISAGCGLSWCTEIEERKRIEDKLPSFEIETEGIYEILM